ncbi:MAG TPA: TadE family type IV pilus minor pilin [Mycobacteriales bacterium]
MTGARRDRGVATAELAVALPALFLVIMAGMTAISVLTAQLRCVDAAREAARAAARGETAAIVRSSAAGAGPAGATVAVTTDAESVTVTVSARSGGGRGLLPSFRVAAAAVARREPEGTGVP